MIVIPIKSCTNESEASDVDNKNADSPIEWSLIELNGELLPPKHISPTHATNDLDTTLALKVELGSLYFDSKVSIHHSFQYIQHTFIIQFFCFYLCISISFFLISRVYPQ